MKFDDQHESVINISEKWTNVEDISNDYARICEENVIMREKIGMLKAVTAKQSKKWKL